MSTSSTLRRGVGSALAAATTATALVAAAPAASADPSGITDNCDLRTTVGEIAADGYGDDNIIVFREDHMASFSFTGIERSGRVVAHGCQENDNKVYLWFAFAGDGEFVRSGDGGYRNWAFSGVWDRPEDTVVRFHAR